MSVRPDKGAAQGRPPINRRRRQECRKTAGGTSCRNELPQPGPRDGSWLPGGFTRHLRLELGNVVEHGRDAPGYEVED